MLTTMLTVTCKDNNNIMIITQLKTAICYTYSHYDLSYQFTYFITCIDVSSSLKKQSCDFSMTVQSSIMKGCKTILVVIVSNIFSNNKYWQLSQLKRSHIISSHTPKYVEGQYIQLFRLVTLIDHTHIDANADFW